MLGGKPDVRRQERKKTANIGRKAKNCKHGRGTWGGASGWGTADHPTVGRNGAQQAGSGMEYYFISRVGISPTLVVGGELNQLKSGGVTHLLG